jgi:uncharacterized membrane protein YhiD involved in acid resistance
VGSEHVVANSSNIGQQLLYSLHGGAFTGPEMLINMSLALVLGLLLASVYRYTHKGLSYSQSFTLTIVFVTTIVAMTLMAIESSLARAFALVGALSIIRFRTVVKDTKDTAFVFAGLAAGTAAGTSNYFLAVLGGCFISTVAIVLHKLKFGAATKGEFMLRFTFDTTHDSGAYLNMLSKNCLRSTLLCVEPSSDSQFLTVSYDASLNPNVTAQALAREMARVAGVSDIRVIASQSDLDY